MHLLRLIWLMALALWAGCASYGPTSLGVAATVAEATQAMGAPSGDYGLPDAGRRLEFARGPYGKHTWMLDFDASGRLIVWHQVLTEARFNAILAGMAANEVLQRIGHPSDTSPLPYQRRQLWSYRYEGPFCLWFQVGIDAQGQVADTGYARDPICETEPREWPL